MHQFQDAVAAALDGQVRALDELGQPRVGLNQIVAVALRMRRSETDAFQPLDFVDRVEQLDEGRFAVCGRDALLRVLAERQLGPTEPTFAVAGDDLAEQRDFFHAL